MLLWKTMLSLLGFLLGKTDLRISSSKKMINRKSIYNCMNKRILLPSKMNSISKFSLSTTRGGSISNTEENDEKSSSINYHNTNYSQSVNNNNSNSQNSKSISTSFFGSKLGFIEWIFRRFYSIFINDLDLLIIISRISSTIFWCFLFLSVIGTIGFDIKPFLSLLSISGLTLGFAAKDILTNIFAGIFIVFTKPFKRGDIITVNGFKGTVLSLDMRYVKLQCVKDSNKITLIPLSMVYGNAIVLE
eukprot:gene14165-19006_t